MNAASVKPDSLASLRWGQRLRMAGVCLALGGVLTGCASTGGLASHAQRIRPADIGLTPSERSTSGIGADWWRALGDDQLDALIERTLAANPSLRIAQARIEHAVGLLAGNRAAEGMQVNANADATRQRFSATSIYPPPLGGSIQTLVSAQVGIGYEFDFFGRNRAAIAAALGEQQATVADAAAARSALATQVARNYVQLGRLHAQRQLASQELAVRERTLALLAERFRHGIDGTLELRQSEGAPAGIRQQIAALDEQIALVRHALAALSAQPPSALDTVTAPLTGWRDLPLPTTLPADLLARRADVAAALWRVRAATSNVDVAQSQFYPNINLTAFAGLASIGFNRFIQAGSEQFGVGPALRLPLFDGGRLRANLKLRVADLDAAIETYNRTVLDAVHDAADQIAAAGAIEQQARQQQASLRAASAALGVARDRHDAGLSNALGVLAAQGNLLTQERQACDLRARAIDAQILLAHALGGGYIDEPLATGGAPSHPRANYD